MLTEESDKSAAPQTKTGNTDSNNKAQQRSGNKKNEAVDESDYMERR